MYNVTFRKGLLRAAIATQCLLLSGTVLAAPQLTEHWESLSALGKIDVATVSLPKAIAAIEAKTGGRVMNIRYENDGGNTPIYDAVVVRPHAVGVARLYVQTGEVSGIGDDKTSDRSLKWKQRDDVTSFDKATVALSKAIDTAEQVAGAPAINAGLAKSLTPINNVLAYNIEVVKDGRSHRIAIDATTNEVIADPSAMGLDDRDPAEFLPVAPQ